MAIYEVNPDYPVPGQPFQLYQCPEVRNNPANQSQLAYWYNGQSLTPTYPPTLSGGNQGYQGMAQPMDSRRYDAPQQPMMQMRRNTESVGSSDDICSGSDVQSVCGIYDAAAVFASDI